VEETDKHEAARALYEELTDDLLYDPAVGRSTMMGFPCVRRADQFFGSFDHRTGALVVKLSRERVGELVASGEGDPFAPAGRTFREWVSIPRADPERWRVILAEALAFAGGAAD
jgi:hypothetical protein